MGVTVWELSSMQYRCDQQIPKQALIATNGDGMTTTRDGLLCLRAAQRAFELAGNRYLANCAKEWASEVEEEIKAEDRAERYDKTPNEETIH